MPNELYNEMYFLFLNIKNISFDDLSSTLDNFLKENLSDGISEEYIFFTLRNAFETGEVMGEEITNKTTLRLCNEWLKKQETPKLSTLIEKVIEVGKVDNIETIIEPKEPLIFAKLFKPKYGDKLIVLFERLKLNGYTDENNDWIISHDTNEPAKLFHYLKDNNVFIAYKFAPSIRCFYKEFGCEIVEKINGNPRATTRKNANDAKNSVIEKNFDNFLLSWIDKK